MKFLKLLGLCCALASCSVPHKEEVRFLDADGGAIANFPVRVELGDGLTIPHLEATDPDTGEVMVVSQAPSETTSVLDMDTFETATDSEGRLGLVYYDTEYDEYRKNQTGWRKLFHWDGPPSVRRVTIVPLKDLPAGSRINVPTSHVKR